MIHLGFQYLNFSLKDYKDPQTWLILCDNGLSGGINLNLFTVVEETLCMTIQPPMHVWNRVKEHHVLREFTSVVPFQDSLVAIGSDRCEEAVS